MMTEAAYTLKTRGRKVNRRMYVSSNGSGSVSEYKTDIKSESVEDNNVNSNSENGFQATDLSKHMYIGKSSLYSQSQKELRKELLRTMPEAKELPTTVYCRKCGAPMRLVHRRIPTGNGDKKITIAYRCPQRSCQTFKSPKMVLSLMQEYKPHVGIKSSSKGTKQDNRKEISRRERGDTFGNLDSLSRHEDLCLNSTKSKERKRHKHKERKYKKHTPVKSEPLDEELNERNVVAGTDRFRYSSKTCVENLRLPDDNDCNIRRSKRLEDAPTIMWPSFVSSHEEDEYDVNEQLDPLHAVSCVPLRITNRKVTVNPGAVESEVFESLLGEDYFDGQFDLFGKPGTLELEEYGLNNQDVNDFYVNDNIEDIVENKHSLEKDEHNFVTVGNDRICIDLICNLVNSDKDYNENSQDIVDLC